MADKRKPTPGADRAIWQGLTEILVEVFDDPGITPTAEMTAGDIPAWDSMKMVEILLAIEDRFAIKLRASDIDRLGRVGDLVERIRTRLRG